MPSARYVPDYLLSIDGSPVPAQLRASISSVSHTSGLEGADRVELAVVNESLRWLDHPLLALDNDLELSIGYADDELVQVFVGEIVSHSASFSGGTPMLTVCAQDAMARMQAGQKVRKFEIPIPTVGNYPLPDLVTTGLVSLENGMIPLVDAVGAALSAILTAAEAASVAGDAGDAQRSVRKQVANSDFSLLTEIAAENGWEMYVEHRGALGGHQLRFEAPMGRISPDVVLRLGESLVDFSPQVSNVGQIVSVSAYIWIAPIKTTFTISVGWDWDRMALSVSITPALLQLGAGPSKVIIGEPVTPVTAPRRILSTLIPRLNERLTGSGSTIGDPTIIGGSVLQLEGLGEEFSGLYRVTSATHTLDAAGFQTQFDVRKDIWFGAIPKPDQGASAINVVSPLGSF